MFISSELLNESLNSFGLSLSREQIDMFDRFACLLVRENAKYNLTAILEPDAIVLKHFVDSLLLLKFINFPQKSLLADVGTGAGFPGLALLIARPDLMITFIDSTAKKLNFVELVLGELSLFAQTKVVRSEEAGQSAEFREGFDFVTARAVADLSVLSELCLPLVKVGGIFAPMKGTLSKEELASGKSAISTLGGSIEDVFEYELPNCDKRMIVYAKKISQTSPKYPRNFSQISKNPL